MDGMRTSSLSSTTWAGLGTTRCLSVILFGQTKTIRGCIIMHARTDGSPDLQTIDIVGIIGEAFDPP